MKKVEFCFAVLVAVLSIFVELHCVHGNSNLDVLRTDISSHSSVAPDNQYIRRGAHDNSSSKAASVKKTIGTLSRKDIYGIIFLALISVCVVSVGLGGGAISIPVLVLVLNYNPREAAVLSMFIVAATSFAAFILNFMRNKQQLKEFRLLESIVGSGVMGFCGDKKKAANKEQGLIDVSVVAFISPFLCAGTLIGAIFNRICPVWICLCCLLFLLITGFLTTLRKYLTADKLVGKGGTLINVDVKHNEAITKEENEEKGEDSVKLIADSDIIMERNLKHLNDICSIKKKYYLQAICPLVVMNNENLHLNEKKISYSRLSVWFILLCFCLFACWMTLIRAGTIPCYPFQFLLSGDSQNFPTIEAFSRDYWIFGVINFALLCCFPLLLGFDTLVRLVNLFTPVSLCFKNTYDVQGSSFARFVKYMLRVNVVGLQLIAIGTVSGAGGASGGVLLTPLFLELGFDSLSITANNATSLFIAASITAANYALSGNCEPDIAMLLFGIAFGTTILCKLFIDPVLRRPKYSRFITPIFMLVLFTCILTTISVLVHTIWV